MKWGISDKTKKEGSFFLNKTATIKALPPTTKMQRGGFLGDFLFKRKQESRLGYIYCWTFGWGENGFRMMRGMENNHRPNLFHPLLENIWELVWT